MCEISYILDILLLSYSAKRILNMQIQKNCLFTEKI